MVEISIPNVDESDSNSLSNSWLLCWWSNHSHSNGSTDQQCLLAESPELRVVNRLCSILLPDWVSCAALLDSSFSEPPCQQWSLPQARPSRFFLPGMLHDTHGSHWLSQTPCWIHNDDSTCSHGAIYLTMLASVVVVLGLWRRDLGSLECWYLGKIVNLECCGIGTVVDRIGCFGQH